MCASFEPHRRFAAGRDIKPLQSLGGWTQWSEPIESAAVKPGMFPPASVFASATPIEMTNLTSALTTFAFYETELPNGLVLKTGSTLTIPTHNAMAFVAFVDGKEVSATLLPCERPGSALAVLALASWQLPSLCYWRSPSPHIWNASGDLASV